jgi:hypothetical protein
MVAGPGDRPATVARRPVPDTAATEGALLDQDTALFRFNEHQKYPIFSMQY